jgi:hypothetical protein
MLRNPSSTIEDIMFSKMLPVLTAGVIAAALALADSPQKSALDKATLESYIRHLFVMDSRIAVQIGDPKPSQELPGFLEVRAGHGLRHRAQPV